MCISQQISKNHQVFKTEGIKYTEWVSQLMEELRSQTEDVKESPKLVPAGGYCHLLYEGSSDVEFRKYGRMFGLCRTMEKT